MYNKKPITKDFILDNVAQESIFAAYWDVTEREINMCINHNALINSVIRDDKDASMGFRYKGNQLRCRDFGGYFWGDCFDAVAHSLLLDANDSRSFMIILTDIAKKFNLIAGESGASSPYKKDVQRAKKDKTVIDIVQRDWNDYDYVYWNGRYTLSRKELNDANIFAVSHYYVNKTCRYWYNPEDPAYAYYLGNKDNTDIWRIYHPRRKKYKFIMNEVSMQGILGIKKAEIGIIIKSYKDTVIGRKLANKLSIPIDFIGGSSESILPKKATIDYLYTFWDVIYSFYDFDYTGIKFARLMRQKYGIEPLFLTNGRFGSLDFKAKDLADYVDNNGIEKALNLMQYVYENGNELTTHFLNFNDNFLHH